MVVKQSLTGRVRSFEVVGKAKTIGLVGRGRLSEPVDTAAVAADSAGMDYNGFVAAVRIFVQVAAAVVPYCAKDFEYYLHQRAMVDQSCW